jgi:G3E family GTPase
MVSADADRIAVIVVTGFLGSGKTTLLRHLLADPALSDTAVLVNEFGEVGLDHHLLRRVDDDIVLLQNGCVCCTIRGDLTAAIRDLYDRRERGEVAPFRRLAIETTGLADPVPILATVMAEPVIRHHFRLGRVIATVDGVNGGRHLDEHSESVKQAAVADQIVVSKTDLAAPGAVQQLTRRLRLLNPSADLLSTTPARMPEAEWLLGGDPFDPGTKGEFVQRWLAMSNTPPDHGPRHTHALANRHDQRIGAFCLIFDRPLDWTVFGIWLSMLLHSRGADVLRVKGLLDVGSGPPVVINGVQHLVHPPIHLAAWPDADHRSRLVFITRDIGKGEIERSLAAFGRLVQPASTT